MKNKIFDCVTFFNENLQLKIRFNILNKWVNKFIICESEYDHQGRKKKINFNADLFPEFRSKIIHIICDNFPQNLNGWERQALQREFIFQGLDEASGDDSIIFSDPDEIPNLKMFHSLDLKKKYGIFMQKSYCYKINLFNQYETPWEGSRICKKKYLKSIDWLRQKVVSKNLKYKFFGFFKEKNIQLLSNGGWHFNCLMKAEDISIKLKTFAHTEYNLEKFTDINVIKKKIDNFQDLFNRGYFYKKVAIDDDFPKYLRENKNIFKDWII